MLWWFMTFLFGFILPFFGFREIPCYRNGEPIGNDDGDILDASSRYYLRVLVFEWLGFGFPITGRGYMFDRHTGEQLSE
jgi:hypothetical protein